MAHPGPGAVLLVVDVQQGFDDPKWGERNNPAFETNLRAVLQSWRATGRPVVHVRHDSTEPTSPFRPGQPGNRFRPEAVPLRGETVVAKSVHSAFIGTELQDVLVGLGATELVVCGIQTNYCVATTARMAGNLGYRTWVVGDACATYPQTDRAGRRWSAAELHAVALMELDGEFATVVDTATLVPPVAAR